MAEEEQTVVKAIFPLDSLTCDQVIYAFYAIGLRDILWPLRAKNITGEDLTYVQRMEDLLDFGMKLLRIQYKRLFLKIVDWQKHGVSKELFHPIRFVPLVMYGWQGEDIETEEEEEEEEVEEEDDPETVIFATITSSKKKTAVIGQKRKLSAIQSKTSQKQPVPNKKMVKNTEIHTPEKKKAVMTPKTTSSTKPAVTAKSPSIAYSANIPSSPPATASGSTGKSGKALTPHEVYTIMKDIETIRSTQDNAKLETFIQKGCIASILKYISDSNYQQNIKAISYALDSLIRLVQVGANTNVKGNVAIPVHMMQLSKFHQAQGWEKILDLLHLHQHPPVVTSPGNNNTASSSLHADLLLKLCHLLQYVHRTYAAEKVFLKKKGMDLLFQLLQTYYQKHLELVYMIVRVLLTLTPEREMKQEFRSSYSMQTFAMLLPYYHKQWLAKDPKGTITRGETDGREESKSTQKDGAKKKSPVVLVVCILEDMSFVLAQIMSSVGKRLRTHPDFEAFFNFELDYIILQLLSSSNRSSNTLDSDEESEEKAEIKRPRRSNAGNLMSRFTLGNTGKVVVRGSEKWLSTLINLIFCLSTEEHIVTHFFYKYQGLRWLVQVLDGADLQTGSTLLFAVCDLLTNLFACAPFKQYYHKDPEASDDVKELFSLLLHLCEVFTTNPFSSSSFLGASSNGIKDTSGLEAVLRSINHMTLYDFLHEPFQSLKGLDMLKQIIIRSEVLSGTIESTTNQNLRILEIVSKIFLNFSANKSYHSYFFKSQQSICLYETLVRSLDSSCLLQQSIPVVALEIMQSIASISINLSSREECKNIFTSICSLQKLLQIFQHAMSSFCTAALALDIVIWCECLTDSEDRFTLTRVYHCLRDISLQEICKLLGEVIRKHGEEEPLVFEECITLMNHFFEAIQNSGGFQIPTTNNKQKANTATATTATESNETHADSDGKRMSKKTMKSKSVHVSNVKESEQSSPSADTLTNCAIPLLSHIGRFSLFYSHIMTNISNRQCMEEVCYFFRILCMHVDNKEHVGDYKYGIDAFAQIWYKHKNVVTVLEEVGGVIKELVNGSNQNQVEVLSNENLLDAIIEAMTTHCLHENIIDVICKIMICLSRQIDILEENILTCTPFLKHVLKNLILHQNNRILIARMIRLLQTICTCNDVHEMFQAQIAISGIPIEVLPAPSTQDLLPNRSQSSSSHIALVPGMNMTLSSEHSSGLHILLSLLRYYANEDVKVVRAILELLQMFGMESDTSVLLGELGFCSMCMELIDTYADESSMLESIFLAIYNIIHDRTNVREFRNLKLLDKLYQLRRNLKAEDVKTKEHINEIIPYLQGTSSSSSK